MAFTIADRVLDTTISTVSPFALSGTAPVGYKTFLTGIGNGNSCYYTIQNPANGEWETGTATLSGGTTLTRASLIGSSTGSVVTFSAGTKYIFVALPASKNIYLDNSNVVNVAGDVTATSYNGGQLAGFRNKIINGDMRVAQRGTSYAITSAVTYGCQDRWAVKSTTAPATLSQTSGFSNQGFGNFARIQRTSGTTATGTISLCTALETIDCISLADKPAFTLSFYAKAGANFSGANALGTAGSFLNATIIYGTLTDQSTTSLIDNTWTGGTLRSDYISLTTTLTRYTITVQGPADCRQIGIVFNFKPTGTADVSDSYDITGVQLEVGSVATPFEQRPYGTELALCQRYLPVLTSGSYIPAPKASTTSAIAIYSFKVPTRVSPTGLTAGVASTHVITDYTAGPNSTSTVAFGTATVDTSTIIVTTTGGSVAGSASYMVVGDKILFTGCEL